jgi:alanyl-tRNA synthetase
MFQKLVGEKNLNAGQVVRELGKFIKVVAGTTVFATAGGKDAAEFNKL